MSLSRPEVLLAQLAASQPRSDQILNALLRIADRQVGIACPINIVVGGIIISGRIGSTDEFAGTLDHELGDALADLAEAEDGSSLGAIATEAAKALDGAFTKLTARRRIRALELQKRHEAFAAESEPEGEDTPFTEMLMTLPTR